MCAGARADCEDWEQGTIYQLIENAQGALTLAGHKESLGIVWFVEGFNIRKADAATRNLVTAYATAPEQEERSNVDTLTVDRDGDVYAMSDTILMKIAAAEATCEDRNGNGLVETSRRWDEVLPFPAAELWEDECILWRAVTPQNPAALVVVERAALDGLEERVWIGLTDEQVYMEFDAATGELTGRDMQTPGIWPAMAVVDSMQRIWTSSYGGESIGVFDPEDLAAGVQQYITQDTQLIGIDEHDQIWVSGGNVRRLDQATGQFDSVFAPDDLQEFELSNGYMTSDGEGNLWQAAISYPLVNRIDIETLEWESIPLPLGGSYNVGVDSFRQLWMHTLQFDHDVPNAWVLDLQTQELTRALDECVRCRVMHSQGDFTSFTPTLLREARGIWTRDVTACQAQDAVHWSSIRGSARVPAGSSIEIWIRTAVDPVLLWEGPWRRVGILRDGETSLDLTALMDEETLTHRNMAVQARLSVGRRALAPELSWLEVRWGCEEPLQ